MTLLSRRCLLAVAAVVDVALHARPSPVAAKALSSRHGVGARHLEPVLHELVRAGILKGVRGPRGGYELARERRRISVGDIVRAAERQPATADGLASELIASVVGPAIDEAATDFRADLDRITVADLCGRAGHLVRDAAPFEYTI